MPGSNTNGSMPDAVRVGVGPDLAAVAEKARRLALDERRVGEQGGGDRLQRQADPELAHHVGLGREVEVHLHGAGAQHHVEAELADLGHVAAHDLVAALGHPGDVLAAPFRLEAHAQHADASGSAIFFTSSRWVCASQQVWCSVSSGAPLSSNWPPGSRLMLQPCLVSAIGLPFSSTGSQPKRSAMPFQQRADAARAVVRQRSQILAREAELLVLGADAPCDARLATAREIIDQLALAGDRLALAARWCRHAVPFPAVRAAGRPDSAPAPAPQSTSAAAPLRVSEWGGGRRRSSLRRHQRHGGLGRQ